MRALFDNPPNLDHGVPPSADRGSAPTFIAPGYRGDVSGLFRSFWIGGFESASHINGAGTRIDMVSATQHDQLVNEDYSRLAEFGIRTVREGVRWHLMEKGREFDFSTLLPTLEAARRHRIQ